jgi:hypothetical protein
MKGRVRSALLLAIGVLYAISIPWYRPSGEPASLVFGFPDWVTVAVGCYAAAAVLNAAAWLLTEIPEEKPPEEDAER